MREFETDQALHDLQSLELEICFRQMELFKLFTTNVREKDAQQHVPSQTLVETYR